MKQLLSIVAVFTALTFGVLVFAQDNPQNNKMRKSQNDQQIAVEDNLDEDVEEETDEEEDDDSPKTLEDYSKLYGVQNDKYDEDGNLVSVLVIAKASINTSLELALGKDLAHRKASLVCDALFAQWRQENLEVSATVDDESISATKDMKKTGSKAQRETESKSNEIQTQKISIYAKQTLRSMKVLYSKYDAEKEEFVFNALWTNMPQAIVE